MTAPRRCRVSSRAAVPHATAAPRRVQQRDTRVGRKQARGKQGASSQREDIGKEEREHGRTEGKRKGLSIERLWTAVWLWRRELEQEKKECYGTEFARSRLVYA